MRIVFLDRAELGTDIDLKQFEQFGDFEVYEYSTPSEVKERVADADIILTNSVQMNDESLAGAGKLKLICVTATGTNMLDKAYLAERGIAWRNVAGYSTESVAQHTFAMLFYLLENLPFYDEYVKSGRYTEDYNRTHYVNKFHELSGMTWGIIGLGAIGRRVADLASAFGCHVIYYSTTGAHDDPVYTRVTLEKLLETSDVVSVHAPLNDETRGMMNAGAYARMKKNAIFLNVGRGAIVDEMALYEALEKHQIAAAGLDVIAKEPASPDNPLLKIGDSGRLLITPHIAWGAVEARTRLMDIIAGQIREFLKGETQTFSKQEKHEHKTPDGAESREEAYLREAFAAMIGSNRVFYLVDLVSDTYIMFKHDQESDESDFPKAGVFSEHNFNYSMKYVMPEYVQERIRVASIENLKRVLRDMQTVSVDFQMLNGEFRRTTFRKIESEKGVPTKVIFYSEQIPSVDRKLKIRTFGNFEVYTKDGEQMHFSRSLSKTILAFLVHRKGYPVTSKEIARIVLNGQEFNDNISKQISQAIRDLKKNLAGYGYTDIVEKNGKQIYVKTENLDCDYYRFLQGEQEASGRCQSEYLQEYSWARS